jgi:hypothetical protein
MEKLGSFGEKASGFWLRIRFSFSAFPHGVRYFEKADLEVRIVGDLLHRPNKLEMHVLAALGTAWKRISVKEENVMADPMLGVVHPINPGRRDGFPSPEKR